MKRVIVRIYLPIEMGAAARILKAAAQAYPDAVLKGKNPKVVTVEADADETLTRAERRKLLKVNPKPRRRTGKGLTFELEHARG